MALLADPDRRAAILAEYPNSTRGLTDNLDRTFPLGERPDYEPGPSQSVAAMAARAGVRPEELLYDLLTSDGGQRLLYVPIINFAGGDLSAVAEMLAHPHTIPGLGDGGAHVGIISDGSFPTTLLAHWGRDRTRGDRFPIEWLVRRHTRDTAEAVGLLDRGVLAPGYKADVNVIDFAALGVCAPRMVYDLPAGGRRLMQPATGYLHTVCAGTVVQSDGSRTGDAGGRLVRGPQRAATTAGASPERTGRPSAPRRPPATDRVRAGDEPGRPAAGETRRRAGRVAEDIAPRGQPRLDGECSWLEIVHARAGRATELVPFPIHRCGGTWSGGVSSV